LLGTFGHSGLLDMGESILLSIIAGGADCVVLFLF
jgi:hypothetical protein